MVDSVEFTGSKSGNGNSSPAQSVVQKAGSMGIPAEYEDILSGDDAPF